MEANIKLFAPLHRVVSEFHPISICDASLQPSQGLAKVPQKKTSRSVKCNTERKITGKATVSSPPSSFIGWFAFQADYCGPKRLHATQPSHSSPGGPVAAFSHTPWQGRTGMFC